MIAEHDDECFDLIVDYDDGFNQNFYVNLREKVLNAWKFALLEEQESRIVESFTT